METAFDSPDGLWKFASETAAMLRAAGLAEAGDVLEAATTYVTSSGWEWLNGLGGAVADIKSRFEAPPEIDARLERIRTAGFSNRPYG